MRRCFPAASAASAAALILLLAATPALAQKGAVELGVDARFAGVKVNENDAILRFQVPAPVLRLGFMVTETVALEPALALFYLNDLDGNSASDLDLSLGVLWHSAPLDQRPTYVGALVGIHRLGGNGESVHQFGFGGRLGLKPALGDAGLWRLGAFVVHYVEDEDEFISARTEYGIEAGFSLLIR